jgi:hypothetical protein
MDPLTILGALSAIGALIDYSEKVIRFLVDVKDATADRQKIVLELQNNVHFLRILKETPEKDLERLPNIGSLLVGNGPLDAYKKIIEDLVPKLTTAKGLSDFPKKFKFATRQDGIKDTLASLERYKSTFMLCLSRDQL